MKRTLSIVLVLCVLLSLFSVGASAAATQPGKYSTSSNSGTREVVCTTLGGTSAGSYYVGAYTYKTLSSQSGIELLQSLRKLMTDTHTTTTSYNDCHDYAAKTDCQNADGTVVLLYTSYAATMSDYDGSNGWNREHVWPKSLGGFKTSGPGADLHHIRPSDSKVNRIRDNKKYGNVTNGSKATGTSLVGGMVGGTSSSSYFEPLDNVKGDVARICLYVYARYGGSYSQCSSITNVFQSVDVLLKWCEQDPVDTWEMGRNEVVASIQGNRNVFIDYPEYAWLLFGREIPSGMTTPSGEAKSSTGGSGGNGGTVTGCTHSRTELRNVKEATCAAEGYTGDTCCASCGKLLSRGQATPKSAEHTPEVVEARPASCGEAGYSGDTVCSVCGEMLETGTTLRPTGGHNRGDWVVVKEATETETGLKERVCIVCGAKETKEIPMLAGATEAPIEGTDAPDHDTPSRSPDWQRIVLIAVGCCILIGGGVVLIILLKKRREND